MVLIEGKSLYLLKYIRVSNSRAVPSDLENLSKWETDVASAKGCHSESLFNELLYFFKASRLLLLITSRDQLPHS